MSLETVDEGWPKFEISRVAASLESQMRFFDCDIDTAWRDHMHDLVKEQFSLKKVKSYMMDIIVIASKAAGGWDMLPDETKTLFLSEEITDYERRKYNGNSKK